MNPDYRIHFNSIPSTNTYCKEYIDFLPSVSVVSASTQTRGRGRRERVWLDEQSALFSICLKNKEVLKIANLLPMIAAASIYTVIHRLLDGCKIKWPNDLLVNGKKIAGVLIESVLSSKMEKAYIVGIGINVGSKEIVKQIDQPATSLTLERNQEVSVKEIIDAVLESFGIFYEDALEKGSMAYDVCRRNLANVGKEALWVEGSSVRSVDIVGLLPSGELAVVLDGREIIIRTGELVQKKGENS